MDTPLHDLVKRTFAAVEAKDLDAMLAVFAEGALVIDPHYPTPRMYGKPAITEGFRWGIASMKSFGFTIENYFESSDGNAQRSRRNHIISSNKG